jgi:hypothetical protein
VIIIAYVLAANLPCILVQRYNRVRFAQYWRAAAEVCGWSELCV